ncbi:nucleobindin-2-like isoform X2 [Brevipalpus obovatus]|uniref:nucleobindin-2-like isoform X2 n=1 Tax=Brevipalpus obovatus TaxID=246614 RepID=UPI003D9E2892
MFWFTFMIVLTQVLPYWVDCAPVDPVKSDSDIDNQHNPINDLGLEYGRYLQEVVQVLEEDKDFAKKLENVSADHIKSGAIAHELNFVNHQIRTKLDELKRVELDRLRKLTKQEHDAKEGIEHVDHQNPHSFEVQDLHKLIVKATRDLEELDQKRREEFKRYEMEKEYQYRESLKNMTEEQKTEAIRKHDEIAKKHKEHPRIHHPGSKQQLEEVWEEQDHMPKEEFNPKTFFAIHDVNGDGYLDSEEVEALLSIEIKKMYDPNNPEDDPNEMEEEYHRMREHIYKEADKNKDGLISQAEFIELTQRSDFERDEGWKGLDDQQVFNENELRQYESKRQELMAQQYGYYPNNNNQRHQQQPYMHYPPPPPPHVGPAYQVGGQQGYQQYHPQQGYQAPPQFAAHPNSGQYNPNQGHPNQQYQQPMHPAQQQGMGQPMHHGQQQGMGQPMHPAQQQGMGQPMHPAQQQGMGQPMHPSQQQGMGQPMQHQQQQGYGMPNNPPPAPQAPGQHQFPQVNHNLQPNPGMAANQPPPMAAHYSQPQATAGKPAIAGQPNSGVHSSVNQGQNNQYAPNAPVNNQQRPSG